MKTNYYFLSILFLFAACSQQEKNNINTNDIFVQELAELQPYFSIPGMAAIVEKDGEIEFESYTGYRDLNSKEPVDSFTAFPIASITKVYSASLILQLAEQGYLSLDDPINKFIPDSDLSESIQVKNLMSHTSQGIIGQQFFYSYRYGFLTAIIESVTGKQYDQSMEELFRDLNLENTFLLKDSSQLFAETKNVALPYILNGEIQEGFIDYGYSTSAGVVATARDLLRFSQGIDNSRLISKESKEAMFSPFFNGSPYGYGVFSQQIEGIDIVWAYGQYDCYSSLLLKVPAKNMTLVLLANNSLMSDPARLIMGNVTSSLFALSFLKNFVFEYPDMKLLEEPGSMYNSTHKETDLYRRKVLAQALAESFLARFNPERNHKSAEMIAKTFEQYPEYLDYADINLLHNLSFMKTVAFYMDLGEWNQFNTNLELIGEKLLNEAPNNPYIHVYMGSYYHGKGEREKARFHYESIINAENFSPFWYTSEAQNWLAENK